jgi:hypothetical protein
MRARIWLPGTLCLLVPLMFACTRSDRTAGSARNGTVLESSQAGDRTKDDLVLVGQLRSVDPDKETLIVAFADDLYQFAYTDSTQVVGGTSNVQGLTGNTGTEVTVHYRQNPITSTKTAVRIELQ